MIEKIILKKSAVLDKMPTAEQLDYGEIALNFNTMNPFISFKDTADGIRQIKDYSNEIQNINGSLTDAKNEINYLRPLVTDNHTNLMFLRGDFEDFKADNTKTINTLDRNVSQNGSAIATLSTSVDKKVSKTDIVQSTGTSETAVMSQKAVNDALSTKVGKTDITQSTGTSETAVMSQKASTMAFAANTPSGDPMHNMYVEVGAVWNAKTGFWELNGLTDITNEQMLTIYVETNNFLMYQASMEACYCFSKCRTNIPNIPYLSSIGRLKGDWIDFFRESGNLEVLVLKNYHNYFFKPKKFIEVLRSCTKLRLIDAILDFSTCDVTSKPIFFNCNKLESVKLYHLNKNIVLDGKMLSSDSVRYMIENATDATITITLHPEAYKRAIADAGVQAALANKTNVSLAKGE